MQSKSTTTVVSLLAVIAIIMSGMALAKTGSGGAAQAEDSLAKIQRTKKMDVCVAEWPPQSIKDATTGKYSGVDIEMLEKMAKELGATVTYHDTTFGNMAGAVQSGTCDIGTSLYVKIGRSAAVDFTRPFLFGGDSALVKKGDTRFKTIQDANKAGIKIAVQNGESGHIYAKEYLTNATIVPIDVAASDLSRFMLEVSSGRADLAIADSNQISRFANTHPETEAIFTDQPFNLNPDGLVVRHGDTALLHFLNNSILYMQVSGELDALFKKYDAHWYQENVKYEVR